MPDKETEPLLATKDNSDTTREGGAPTNPDRSRVSGGGGERDRHHVHDPKNKS